MLETREWVQVILLAVVVTVIVMVVAGLLHITWLVSSAWLLGVVAGAIRIYQIYKSRDQS